MLVPLYERDDELYVVLTTRTTSLRSHSGEVSFPGGRRDGGESLAETALREANEEIDLDPDGVTLIGELDRLATFSSGASIHPYVGILDGEPKLNANPDEVARILHVRLSELLEPGVYREEVWTNMFSDGDRELWFFELVGDTVWGATASMLRQLLVLSLSV